MYMDTLKLEHVPHLSTVSGAKKPNPCLSPGGSPDVVGIAFPERTSELCS